MRELAWGDHHRTYLAGHVLAGDGLVLKLAALALELLGHPLDAALDAAAPIVLAEAGLSCAGLHAVVLRAAEVVRSRLVRSVEVAARAAVAAQGAFLHRFENGTRASGHTF